ncbi:chemotaxis protein CheW [Ekhidna sp.]|uniref:chemotaxis protein CheW n=1 Tax=Ekhidna sp. TaxID=2608089 RepID=UPI003BAD17CD
MALGSNLTKKEPEENSPPVDPHSESKESDSIETIERQDDSKVQNESVDEESVSYEQFCVFKAGGEEYAIPINLVKEVVPYPAVSKIPQMPLYIKGMSNVRGNIFGVMDLNLFFGGDKQSKNLDVKYLLVIDHEKYHMAIEIPEVPDTLMASENMIEKLSSTRLKSKIGQKYLKGIIKKDRRMIILFDILGIISSEKFTVAG